MSIKCYLQFQKLLLLQSKYFHLSCAIFHMCSQQINHVKPLPVSDAWKDPQHTTAGNLTLPPHDSAKSSCGLPVKCRWKREDSNSSNIAQKFPPFKKTSEANNHSTISSNSYFKICFLLKHRFVVCFALFGDASGVNHVCKHFW